MTSRSLGSAFSSSLSGADINFSANGEIILENGLHENEVLNVALKLKRDMSVPQLQVALVNLGLCIKNGNCELPNKHFRAVMRMLLDMLECTSNEVVIEALLVLSKILRRVQMKPNWINFVELILLKIIDCYSKSKCTMPQLDMLIPRIVPAVPLNLAINIVHPVIATSSYPQNLVAMKLFTEFADRYGSDLREMHLDSVFPHLARLTEDSESIVRKAAVFCIVKLYLVMGEAKVKPKLAMLSSSRMAVLNVYIEKQRNGFTSSSTKNSSAPTTDQTKRR